VAGERVVQLDRMRGIVRNETGVIEKFGVHPGSIPDLLAVVGDSADGFPGIAGWGMKAAAQVFSQYPHLEDVPKDWEKWHPSIRRARSLSASLLEGWSDAVLFRTLATLRIDVPVFASLEQLLWKGPRPEFAEQTRRLKAPELLRRAQRINIGA
jgi:5'-3' exonuclease